MSGLWQMNLMKVTATGAPRELTTQTITVLVPWLADDKTCIVTILKRDFNDVAYELV